MAISKVKNSAVQGLSLSSTSTALSIDSNGHITKPLQPAFSVHKNGTSQDNIATETNVIATWSTERFDTNSDFASNIFTASVTGKYYLNCHLRLDSVDSAANYYYGGIATSNQFYYNLFDPDFGQDAAFWTTTVNVLADMDAGDTASAIIYQYAGTQQTDISGSTGFTYFSGCLIC